MTGVAYSHDREKPAASAANNLSRAVRTTRLFIPVGRAATTQSTGLAARFLQLSAQTIQENLTQKFM
jgi:hypothetical protein